MAGSAIQRHNDADHPPYALSTLADFGLAATDPGVDRAVEAVLAGGDHTLFVGGNDAAAKAEVSRLLGDHPQPDGIQDQEDEKRDEVVLDGAASHRASCGRRDQRCRTCHGVRPGTRVASTWPER